jgi:hypothetical protein
MNANSRATYGTEISSTYLGQQVERDERGRPEWPHHAWNVTLTREDQSITFPYRMGLGHEQTKCGKPKPSTISRYVQRPMQTCGHVRCEDAGWQPTPPTLYDVLTGLKADATDGETFADWCANYGYDTDSWQAMETYLACQESEDRSRRFFGADWPRIVEDEDYA